MVSFDHQFLSQYKPRNQNRVKLNELRDQTVPSLYVEAYMIELSIRNSEHYT